MPYLVREHLFIGNIKDAADVLEEGSSEITHILSLLSSPSISFFTKWRSTLSIPAKEIRKVYFGDSRGGDGEKEDDGLEESSGSVSEKVLCVVEYAGKDLKMIRMAVPIRDTESENLLDYLDVCLDFIEESRKQGSVLVHCFAGVSRSAAIITAYLMRSEKLSQEDDGLEESSASVSEKVLCVVEYAGKDLKMIRMAVPIRDTESENLLDYLDVCLDFIEESRKQGSVLVHCFAGVSRSAAIITAYLMRSEKLSQEDALDSLQQSCDFVCPNDGFIDQLKMFEEMGFKVDHASPIYKRFYLKLLGDSFNRGEKMDISRFRADPGLQEKTVNSSRGYHCKKCKRLVALQENVVEHVPGEGETSFGWHRKGSGNMFNKDDEFRCSSIFIEPLRWMKIVEEGAAEGNLSCVQCDARLGSFNWSGIQCSCGSWITPAFQLHKGRLDINTT